MLYKNVNKSEVSRLEIQNLSMLMTCIRTKNRLVGNEKMDKITWYGKLSSD